MKVYMLRDNRDWIGAFSTYEAAEAYGKHCVNFYPVRGDDYAYKSHLIALMHGAPVMHPFYIYEWDMDYLPVDGYSGHPTRQVPSISVYMTDKVTP